MMKTVHLFSYSLLVVQIFVCVYVWKKKKDNEYVSKKINMKI